MRFLVDENLGAGLAAHLRALGHDALSVSKTARGSSDEQVPALAANERRIVVTEDKDFGTLIFARRLAHSGILLVRLRRSLPAQVRAVWNKPSRSPGSAWKAASPYSARAA